MQVKDQRDFTSSFPVSYLLLLYPDYSVTLATVVPDGSMKRCTP